MLEKGYTLFRWNEDAECPPKLQLLRRQDLCSCGIKSVEQFASRVVILPVQAVAEDIFILTVRQRRIVNFFFTVPCTNTPTYLLAFHIYNLHMIN